MRRRRLAVCTLGYSFASAFRKLGSEAVAPSSSHCRMYCEAASCELGATPGRVGVSDVTESPVLRDEFESCCASCFVPPVSWNFKARQAVQRNSQAHVANVCPQTFNAIAPSGLGFQGSKGASHDHIVATQNVHSHGNLGLCWIQTTLLRPRFFSAVLAGAWRCRGHVGHTSPGQAVGVYVRGNTLHTGK